MHYLEALKKRYSVKRFDKDRTVPEDVLKNILEAGRLSVSSQGLQPYEIIVVQSPEMKKKLIPAFYNPSQISTCSHLIVLVSKKSIEDFYLDSYFQHITQIRQTPAENLLSFRKNITGILNVKDERSLLEWNERQAYILLGNLIFAAALENVDTCPMEGFDRQKTEEILEIDTAKQIVTVTLALGYRDPEDEFQNMQKIRKPNEKLIRFV